MNKPRFTFCVPNLNKSKYLPACIQSILQQDCSDWKCVFVDGYSTDGSWEYMQQFSSDYRFLLRQGCQQGMYADWNECLKHVDTDYFYFLTSDDTCFPSLVSTTVKALDLYPDLDACNFQFACIDERGAIILSPEQVVQEHFNVYCDVTNYAHRRSGLCEFMMHFVYPSIYMSITSLVFRSNLLEKMQGFTTLHGSVGDCDWTMRLGLFTDILYIPKLLATWRRYEEQATHNLSSPKVSESYLTIAEDNLNRLLHMNKLRLLKKNIDRGQVLSHVADLYTARLYKQIYSSKSFFQSGKYLYLALKADPFYPIRKSLRRLSRNKLYPYFNKKDFAYQLINDYGLHWPPLQVEVDI
jgi:glycosyltransferase involved in cell wall biosynthesis